MLPRILLLMVTGMVLMSATCKKFDCANSQIEKCEFGMKEIVSSPDGQYTAVTGRRVCNGKWVLQEVAVYKKGEALNNKCGNAYITSDTLSPLHVQWKDQTLQIITPGYKSSSTLFREMKLYKKMVVEYADSLKSPQSTVDSPR